MACCFARRPVGVKGAGTRIGGGEYGGGGKEGCVVGGVGVGGPVGRGPAGAAMAAGGEGGRATRTAGGVCLGHRVHSLTIVLDCTWV